MIRQTGGGCLNSEKITHPKHTLAFLYNCDCITPKKSRSLKSPGNKVDIGNE